MNIRKLICAIFLLASLRCIAQEELSLNGTWQFALAKNEQEAESLKNFFLPDFNDSQFAQILVPSNWAILGYEEPVYRGFEGDKASEGFYLHDFTIPKEWLNRRVNLHFGGVWSSAEVWINGKYLGMHESGYTSFSLDLTGKLNTNGTNRLAVRVRQVSATYKFDVYDDWTLGGIFRDVTLQAMPLKRWMEPAIATTTFDEQFRDANLEVRCMVNDINEGTLPGNYPSPGKSYEMKIALSTKEGEPVASRKIIIPAHVATSREIKEVFHIQSPRQWTAETPYLYDLKIELLEEGKVTQLQSRQIGFRQISVEGGVLRINGQIVKLRGVNRHDEHPDVGRATTMQHWKEDILLMKAANINYIRMAHYQHAKGFVQLCDEMGMYVGAEVSIGGAGDLLYNPSYTAATLLRTYETVMRDINNPSVIYWSIGNEDPLASINLSALKFAKALDPTRPLLIPWRYESWLPKEVDILSVHYWHPREYDQLASQSTRPVITTEYAHAFGGNGFGGLDARWKALTKHAQGAGGAVWMWADQGIRTPVKRPSGRYDKIVKDDEYLRIDDQGWDGIVNSYRKPTRDYWEVKAVYAPVYPAIDQIAFTPGQNTITIPLQNDFDFTNLDKVSIKWVIKEDDKDVDSGTSTASGIPHTIANIVLPIPGLKEIKEGKTYYAWLDFTDATGMHIARKAVALHPQLKASAQLYYGQIKVAQEGNLVTVSIGDILYTFDKNTGQLATAGLAKNNLLSNLKPTIWHTLDHGEQSVIGSKLAGKLPDLNNYTIQLKDWKFREDSAKVIINTVVAYKVNANNHFVVNYQYQIGSDGYLIVQYELLPQIATPNLPIVGLCFQAAPEMKKLAWLGLGPYDAYPNKSAAPILGVWGGAIDSEATYGNKATEWVALTSLHHKINIDNNGYLLHDASSPYSINILSAVLGKPEKGRKPEEASLLLSTTLQQSFTGAFRLRISAIK